MRRMNPLPRLSRSSTSSYLARPSPGWCFTPRSLSSWKMDFVLIRFRAAGTPLFVPLLHSPFLASVSKTHKTAILSGPLAPPRQFVFSPPFFKSVQRPLRFSLRDLLPGSFDNLRRVCTLLLLGLLVLLFPSLFRFAQKKSPVWPTISSFAIPDIQPYRRYSDPVAMSSMPLSIDRAH